jgi:hypothetical protein
MIHRTNSIIGKLVSKANRHQNRLILHPADRIRCQQQSPYCVSVIVSLHITVASSDRLQMFCNVILHHSESHSSLGGENATNLH